MQPMNAMDNNLELRGFHHSRALEQGLDEVDGLEDMRARYREIEYRLGDIDYEISELKSEEEELEEEQIELREEIEQASATAPNSIDYFGCTECSWKTLAVMEPDEWHAEQHAHETGHTVALVQRDGSQFFAQDRIDLEVRI